MKPEDCAYIAGLLDADGWITLHDNKVTISFHVGICNANQEVLEWIRSIFGGVVRAHSRPKSRIGKNWRQIWSYDTRAASVKQFLESIRPFLRIKGRQADIVLEFLGTRHKRSPGCWMLSPELVYHRNGLLREIKSLNQTGRILKLDFVERQPKDPNKPRIRRWHRKPIGFIEPPKPGR